MRLAWRILIATVMIIAFLFLAHLELANSRMLLDEPTALSSPDREEANWQSLLTAHVEF
jgi:hypothetical protein